MHVCAHARMRAGAVIECMMASGECMIVTRTRGTSAVCEAYRDNVHFNGYHKAQGCVRPGQCIEEVRVFLRLCTCAMYGVVVVRRQLARWQSQRQEVAAEAVPRARTLPVM